MEVMALVMDYPLHEMVEAVVASYREDLLVPFQVAADEAD